jgi:hypothetical protein
MHDQHEYCSAMSGRNLAGETWSKKPAQCKFCDAVCVCHCHTHGETVGPQQ